MKRFKILTGNNTIDWQTDWDVFEAHPEKESVSPLTLSEALANPIGTPPLGKLASEAKRVVVILPDATRLWQNIPAMAQSVLAELQAAGCKNATWLIGVGTHRPATDEEVLSIIGSPLPEGHTVVSHDGMNTTDLGQTTERGTPVCVNPALAEADLVILIGGIVYHDLAGFSGGRKALFPGVSAQKSIERNHSLGFLGNGFNPDVCCGSLEKNPLHLDMFEFMQRALAGRKGFLINVIPDSSGKPHSYVSGDPIEAWKEGIKIAVELQTLWVEQKPDTIVVSCGGAPYDLELYQSSKALSAVSELFEEGTSVLLVADLPEGMGTEEFDIVMRLALTDLEAAKARVRAAFTIPGFIAAKIVELYGKCHMVLLTPNKDVAFPGKITDNFDEALRMLAERGRPGKVLFVGAGNAVHLAMK